MVNNRYSEKFPEGSELLWPSDKEDKITRKFYRDLSHFSKKSINDDKRTNLFQQFLKIIFGKGSSPLTK